MKTCIECAERKAFDQFYRHPDMADGYAQVCKSCHKERMRVRRRLDPAVQAYDRKRYHEDPNRRLRLAENVKRWNERNPEGYRAHYVVSNAIRDGKLKRQPCETCGALKAHAHHENYSKPLEVRWLCAMCHQRHHAERA